MAPHLLPAALVITLVAWLQAASLQAHPFTGTSWTAFTVACVSVAALGLILARLVGRRPESRAEGRSGWWDRVLWAYSPTAAALLLAFHLRSAPWLAQGELHLAAVGGAHWAVSLLWLAQVTAVLLGGIMSLWALRRLCQSQSEPPFAPARSLAAWGALALPSVVLLASGLLWVR